MEFSSESSSDFKYEQALQKLNQSWKAKEKELQSEKQQKLSNLTQELNRLRAEYNEARKRVSYFEEKNCELQDQIKEVSYDNLRLEEFKMKLMDSLREDETRHKRLSMKSVEEQGREFFMNAKSRLSYENFSIFSCFVKQLNEKSISKEMALLELKDVFNGNDDLYETFANLLSLAN